MNPVNQSTEATHRVLIVDDHPLIRSGLQRMLDAASDFNVVGEATTGPEAISRATLLTPDLVIMDLQLAKEGTQEMNGIEATREIVRLVPNAFVVMLTMYDDDNSIYAALKAGARSYLLKGGSQDEVLQTLRSVMRGEIVFVPAIAARIQRQFVEPPANIPRQLFPELTERERQLLELIAEGLNYAEAATRMGINERTIRNYASNIFQKLNVADRTEAALLAAKNGLGKKT